MIPVAAMSGPFGGGGFPEVGYIILRKIKECEDASE